MATIGTFDQLAKQATLFAYESDPGLNYFIQPAKKATLDASESGTGLNTFDQLAKRATLSITGFSSTTGAFDQLAKRATLNASGSIGTVGTFVVTAKRATSTYHGNISATRGDITLAGKKGTTQISSADTLTFTAKRSSLSFSGKSLFPNVFDNSAKRATLSITGISGTIGTFNRLAKKATLSAAGFTHTSGTFVAIARRAILYIVPVFTVYYCDVICLDNIANSEYNNFEFNSFASTENYLLGANSSGIYLLSGSDDAGSDIDATIETHQDNFDVEELKSVHDIYVTYEGGAITVRAINEDTVGSAVSLEAITDLKTRRASIGRGIKNINWGVRVNNVSGGVLDIDRIELRPFKLSGRV